MSTPLLLSTHRTLVASRIHSLSLAASDLAKVAQAATSELEFEHALAAIERWGLKVSGLLSTSFADKRLAPDVAGGLHRAIEKERESRSTIYAKSRAVAREIGNVRTRLGKLHQTLGMYVEPPGLPPLSADETAEVTRHVLLQFNEAQKRRVVPASPRAPGPGARTTPSASPADKRVTAPNGRLVFISHSAKDVALAARLVAVLTAAMRLRKADILCTSVAGCTLEGGAQTHERILAEIRSAPVFIALVTAPSVESSYVLFELGARWAVGKNATPVLGPGESYDRLPGPWKGNVHALRTDDPAKVLQLVEEAANALSRELLPTHEWHDEVTALVAHGKS